MAVKTIELTFIPTASPKTREFNSANLIRECFLGSNSFKDKNIVKRKRKVRIDSVVPKCADWMRPGVKAARSGGINTDKGTDFRGSVEICDEIRGNP